MIAFSKAVQHSPLPAIGVFLLVILILLALSYMNTRND